MATYIALCTFTDQGIHGVRDTTRRADAAKDLAARFGANMTQVYWTLGAYDLVVTIEAPDDATATAFGLAVSSSGNIRMQTLRAFSRNEMGDILDRLG